MVATRRSQKKKKTGCELTSRCALKRYAKKSGNAYSVSKKRRFRACGGKFVVAQKKCHSGQAARRYNRKQKSKTSKYNKIYGKKKRYRPSKSGLAALGF